MTMPAFVEPASKGMKRKVKPVYPTSQDAINAFVEGSHFDEVITRSSEGRLHARMAGYCPRFESLASNLTYTDRRTPQMALYAKIGIAVEKALVEGWKTANVLMGESIKLKEQDGLNLGGEIDAIVNIGGEMRVMEVKTCTKLPESPSLQHERQALTYSLFTGLPARIMYASRNVMEYKHGENNVLLLREFVLPFNYEALYPVAETIALSSLYSEALKVAPIPEGFTRSLNCRFCPFVPICYDGEDTALNVPSADLAKSISVTAGEMANQFIVNMSERQQEILETLAAVGSVEFMERLDTGKIKLPNIDEITENGIKKIYR